ncbi:MAG TPA: hypothetical protein VKA26_08245 [Ignavibacteriaceae bacterium]|nr:hypothetical protein [Ignavibacteriaceae bacterium]
MNKSVKQLLEIDDIEKELFECKAGVLAIHNKDDKLNQFPVTFIYKDKNIYFFFEEDDELFESIQVNSIGIFTFLKEEKIRKSKKAGFIPSYKILSVTIFGILKKVEDVKLLDKLRQGFARKYSAKEAGSELDFSILDKALMIDTEEIKAIEEIGG